jgi:hypothetical protein
MKSRITASDETWIKASIETSITAIECNLGVDLQGDTNMLGESVTTELAVRRISVAVGNRDSGQTALLMYVHSA